MKSEKAVTGKAYLVGAGPGRADLISVRGLELLRAADVVIYDRLIAQELLHEIRADAERILAGKQAQCHRMSQAQINALLIKRVRAGKHVVRLKGGDAFIFGRGGEESLALAAMDLPFEVVPGISAALAAPAFAGIPITHRGLSSGFAVIAGHEDPTKAESMIDWAVMAHMPTLIVLMGVRTVEKTCAALIAHGRDPDTPAAAISHGTTDQQQVVRSTVSGLPQAMAQADIRAPAVLIFGHVVALHDRIDWFTPDGKAAGFIPLNAE